MIFWLMNVFMWSEGNFDLQSRWSCDECWSRFYTQKFNIFFWKLLVHMWKCDICLWKANFVSWSDERFHPDTFLKSSSGNFLKKHLIASSSLSSWLQSAVVTSLLQTHTVKNGGASGNILQNECSCQVYIWSRSLRTDESKD